MARCCAMNAGQFASIESDARYPPATVWFVQKQPVECGQHGSDLASGARQGQCRFGRPAVKRGRQAARGHRSETTDKYHKLLFQLASLCLPEIGERSPGADGESDDLNDFVQLEMA